MLEKIALLKKFGLQHLPCPEKPNGSDVTTKPYRPECPVSSYSRGASICG